jgi:amidase
VLALLAPPAAAVGAPRASFTVEETTVADIRAAFADESLSCAQLTSAYLQRIAAYDDAGPELNTLISVAPDAMQQARRLDAANRSLGPVGPLHCIPVILKDNVDTLDMMTTGGSLTLWGTFPTEEAFITADLREAGALILGKGNMDEWAHGGAGGYSSAGGQTRNPYNLGSPSGSSGGPAAAVAANFGVIGIGTDTLGSIRGPVGTNNLAGVKPTLGLVSGTGVIPFALTFDVAGPMTRTVTDAAETLNVIAGYDPADPRTEASLGKVPTDYTDFLDADALEGARIGVLRTYYGTSPLHDQVLADLEAAGAEIIDGIQAPASIRTLSADYYQLISETEFVHYLGEYLQSRRPDAAVQTHADVLAASEADDFPIAPAVLVRLQREATRGTMEDADYLEAAAYAPAAMRAGIDQMLEENDLDALLHTGGSQLESFSGYPSAIVQAGFSENGYGEGIQFLGSAFSEPTLLGFAYAYEQATEHRTAPDIHAPALTYLPPLGPPPGCRRAPGRAVGCG